MYIESSQQSQQPIRFARHSHRLRYVLYAHQVPPLLINSPTPLLLVTPNALYLKGGCCFVVFYKKETTQDYYNMNSRKIYKYMQMFKRSNLRNISFRGKSSTPS